MVAFYNKADQELYKQFQYLPQEEYRLGLNLPKTEQATNSINTTFGIPNTNAFIRSGSGVSGGNAFGYGNAINPADPSVITSGPYAGQSGYYGSANYTGGLPGNVQQSGPGRYFDYGQVNEDGESVFYKDYTLQPRKTVPGFLRAGAAFVPFGNFALNQIEKKMNPTKGLTASEIDKNYMGSYGIAGLSDAQKRAYDNLAGQGMLFDGPGGLKTLTGKNFTGKGYLEGQLDIYNKEFTKPDGTMMTEEEITDLIAKTKADPRRQFKYKQMLEASQMYKTNKAQEKKAVQDAEIAAKKAGVRDTKAAKDFIAKNPNYGDAEANINPGSGGGSGYDPQADYSGSDKRSQDNRSSDLGFSDIRLKENVGLIGKSPSNINIYKFNYKDSLTTYQGVIAHEVPWASVKHSNGYMMVDYNKIDVNFKKI